MSRVRLAIVMVVLALGLAFGIFSLQAVTQAQDTPPVRLSDGLQVYEGNGWWFFYPANATLEMVSETEFRVVGPPIAIRPIDADLPEPGPFESSSFLVPSGTPPN